MSVEELARIAEEMRSNKTRNREQPNGNSPLLLPPPTEPMAVARLFVKTHFLCEQVPTIRCLGGVWWTWRTTHWSEINERTVRSLLYHYTENAIYLDAKGNAAPWAPSRHRVGDLLEALAAICLLPQDFVQPCWLDGRVTGQIVACANGLYDLDGQQLYRHTPLYFSTVSVPFPYDPAAPAPHLFFEFLDALWPQETASVDALQEWFGYVISGRVNLQKMLLMIGPTRGGKGVLARILTALIGDRPRCSMTPGSAAGRPEAAPGSAPTAGGNAPARSSRPCSSVSRSSTCCSSLVT
jgi:putative DNA primase/helicase